jgi:hypothetical protein
MSFFFSFDVFSPLPSAHVLAEGKKKKEKKAFVGCSILKCPIYARADPV